MSSISEILQQVAAKAADITDTDISNISYEVALTDQGIDSVTLMSLAEIAHAHYPDIDFADLAEDTSLEAWREVLLEFED